jgi:hypothetical protein
MVMKRFRWIVIAPVLALLTFTAGAWLYAGMYGVNSLYWHGGSVWLPVGRESGMLSPSMRLALSPSSRFHPRPGNFAWRTIAPGFDVADMPVVAGARTVDRIYLARIDPAHYRFVVRNDPSGSRHLDRWMQELGAALVVNGSYFSVRGHPTTPLMAKGRKLGPRYYDARAGAFVANAGTARIHNLAESDWRHAFRDASDAMVSYPLLLDEEGKRVKVKSEWLANRSFVGEDGQGRIIIGTTTDAYFSLDRLAEFLLDSPLDLRIALNLDGGPVACQGIRLAGYRRMTYGTWEAQVNGDTVHLLTRPYGRADPMPIVLAVLPR